MFPPPRPLNTLQTAEDTELLDHMGQSVELIVRFLAIRAKLADYSATAVPVI